MFSFLPEWNLHEDRGPVCFVPYCPHSFLGHVIVSDFWYSSITDWMNILKDSENTYVISCTYWSVLANLLFPNIQNLREAMASNLHLASIMLMAFCWAFYMFLIWSSQVKHHYNHFKDQENESQMLKKIKWLI